MNYIDAHVHVWTPDTAHYPLAAGFKKEDMKPPSFTPEELFKHSKPAGVDRINLIQMSFYGFDNRYMLDMIGSAQGRLRRHRGHRPARQGPGQRDGRAGQAARAGVPHPPAAEQAAAGEVAGAGGLRAMFAAGAKRNQAMSCLIDPDALPELDRMCTKLPGHAGRSSTTCAASAPTARSATTDVEAPVRDGEAQAGDGQGRGVLRAGEEEAAVHRPGAADRSGGQGVRRRSGACGRATARSRSAGGTPTRTASTWCGRGSNFLTADDRDWLLRSTAEEFFFRA